MSEASFNSKVGVEISESATVSQHASLGSSVKVWNFSQIREGAAIGENTIIGSHVYIDSRVQIGMNCKIQNGALVYEPSVIEDGVFIGPGAILTNDRNPRATMISGKLKTEENWNKVGVIIEQGASIGAGAVCIAPLRIGSWAFVGAGAVVTKDVLPHALVTGNPAHQIGWVGRFGFQLKEISENIFECPASEERYLFVQGKLSEMTTK
jgi:acetyltransferase-like isoleucine patch superfamily enzyme